VCLDAATGKRVWHFQTVHHDLFDYDNPAAPILADITVNGRRIKAVVQVTKQAFAFVLDRVTGQPVWPIEERPVPASTVPGERASLTQPVPSKPPAFDRQGLTVDDLIDFTPALRAEAIEITKKYVTGPMFTPPSIAGPAPGDKQGTIQLPGSVGGADWTGEAFDRETGMLYVPSMTNPFVANLLPGDPARTDLRYRASTRQLIQGPQGLPLTKPPYGRITALNLNRGEQAWMVANGGDLQSYFARRSTCRRSASRCAPPAGRKTLLFVSEGVGSTCGTGKRGGKREHSTRPPGRSCGSRAPRRHHGHDDDLPGQRSSVNRHYYRRPESSGRVHRVCVDRTLGVDTLEVRRPERRPCATLTRTSSCRRSGAVSPIAHDGRDDTAGIMLAGR
jgi:quinoprotein glucose dehydrogenase